MTLESINLGTPPLGRDGDANRTAFGKCNQNFEKINGRMDAGDDSVSQLSDSIDLIKDIQRDHMSGLRLEYVDGQSLRIGSGVALLPDRSIVHVASPLTVSAIISPGTFGHVYVYMVDAVVVAEVVQTAPSAPYFGTARTKAGDTSRRYVGSILADASGAIIRFIHDGDRRVDYLLQTAGFSDGQQRVVAGKKDAVEQAVDLSGIVPVSATAALCLVQMTKADIGGYGTILGPVSGTMSVTTVSPMGCIQASVPLAEPQRLYINVTSSWSGPDSEGAFLDITGYDFAR